MDKVTDYFDEPARLPVLPTLLEELQERVGQHIDAAQAFHAKVSKALGIAKDGTEQADETEVTETVG
jgi:hypothetical protein